MKKGTEKMNKLSNIEDISQLESLGSMEIIRNEINALISPLNTNANTYEELLEVINCLKKNWVGFTDEFFVNESKKYEYILINSLTILK